MYEKLKRCWKDDEREKKSNKRVEKNRRIIERIKEKKRRRVVKMHRKKRNDTLKHLS
jgi:hypothetical protein